MMHPFIKMTQISKHYDMGGTLLKALDCINLSIEAGEYIAVLGPSGSGKSTLMNLLGCLDSPTQGEYLLHGKAVHQLTRRSLADIRNHHIGFIFQSFNLLDYASALDNVALPLVYRGVSKKLRLKKAAMHLEQVGLKDRLHHRPQELSGGQRQRVAIARALVGDPDLLLADEPTGNLDTESSQAIMEQFTSLSAAGKTVIVVTHDLSIAQQIPRTIRIQDGNIIKP